MNPHYKQTHRNTYIDIAKSCIDVDDYVKIAKALTGRRRKQVLTSLAAFLH